MNTQDLISQAEKIKQALNAISVAGYGNIKTLGNCIDAMIELQKNIATYEQDTKNAIEEQLKNTMTSIAAEVQKNQEVVPIDISKPKPKRVSKEVKDVAEN